jgi:hypothetical protein
LRGIIKVSKRLFTDGKTNSKKQNKSRRIIIKTKQFGMSTAKKSSINTSGTVNETSPVKKVER